MMDRPSIRDGETAIAATSPVVGAPDAPPAAPSIPSNLGKYEIITHLASGGMADIFLCRARGIQGFEKLAIIKRVRQDRALDKKMVDLFLDEARLAASLQHPNIVQVFEFGIVEGSYFLAMEYVHGQDVYALVKRMRELHAAIPIPEALTIVVGVCQGLHYAHEHVGLDGAPLAIVHRDISPSNVLISYDGAVMITDFGIAKATGRSTETTTGTVRGKLSYMSPEQCRGLTLDRRSDIFAIGTLLHELSTGRSLFRGTSDFDVMKAIVEDPVPPPSSLVAGYPAELDRIVLKALARDPAQRYATAREMQLDIERFTVEHKLPISTARLANFMQQQFSDRIAEWRGRVAVEYAARAAARPPSAEVEIVGVEDATVADTPAARPRRARAGIVAGVAVAAAVAAVAGYRLTTSHAAATPVVRTTAPIVARAAPTSPMPTVTSRTPAATAPATVAATTAPAMIAPPAATTTAQPAATTAAAATTPPAAATAVHDAVVARAHPAAAPRETAAAAPPETAAAANARERHRRRPHHHAARPAAAAHAPAKSAPSSRPPADWNPEDGLPPGTAH